MRNKAFQLAVNTSLSQAQVLLFDDNGVIENIQWQKAKSHSEVITLLLSQALTKHKLRVQDITKIFCVAGPGSFTGIRVGINFCRALAYSFNIPVCAVNSLDLLSLNGLENNNKTLAVLDAQKNSVFCSLYFNNNNGVKVEAQNLVVPIEKLQDFITEPVIVCGNGLSHYLDFLTPKLVKFFDIQTQRSFPDLCNLLSSNCWFDLETNQKWFELQPVYIKASAPEEKIKSTVFNF